MASILVLEDDDLLRRVLVESLEDEGLFCGDRFRKPPSSGGNRKQELDLITFLPESLGSIVRAWAY